MVVSSSRCLFFRANHVSTNLKKFSSLKLDKFTFLIVMQTRDEVEGLHNCLEFSQPLSCLYLAMQTRKTFSIA